jgi:hypothetical protein
MKDFLVVVYCYNPIPDEARANIQKYVKKCIDEDLPIVLNKDIKIEFMPYPATKAYAYTYPNITMTGSSDNGIS